MAEPLFTMMSPLRAANVVSPAAIRMVRSLIAMLPVSVTKLAVAVASKRPSNTKAPELRFTAASYLPDACWGSPLPRSAKKPGLAAVPSAAMLRYTAVAALAEQSEVDVATTGHVGLIETVPPSNASLPFFVAPVSPTTLAAAASVPRRFHTVALGVAVMEPESEPIERFTARMATVAVAAFASSVQVVSLAYVSDTGIRSVPNAACAVPDHVGTPDASRPEVPT